MTSASAVTGPGTVYLLHFDRPYAHARHYCGWTADLPARLADHAAGQGARLLAVVAEAGIGWTLARAWTGDRARERALKRQGGAARRCPLCGVTPRVSSAAEVERLDPGDDQHRRDRRRPPPPAPPATPPGQSRSARPRRRTEGNDAMSTAWISVGGLSGPVSTPAGEAHRAGRGSPAARRDRPRQQGGAGGYGLTAAQQDEVRRRHNQAMQQLAKPVTPSPRVRARGPNLSIVQGPGR